MLKRKKNKQNVGLAIQIFLLYIGKRHLCAHIVAHAAEKKRKLSSLLNKFYASVILYNAQKKKK